MSLVIECRSPADVDDDELSDAHTECVNALKACESGRYIYTGDHRGRIKAHTRLLEKCIESGTPWPGRLGVMFLTLRVIAG